MKLRDSTPIDEAESGILALREHHAFASRMPVDTLWFRAEMPADEVRTLIHIVAPLWAELSGGTGLVRRSAQAVNQGHPLSEESARHAAAIREIADRFESALLGRMILGTNDLDHGPGMVLDGNHRAVALELIRCREADSRPDRIPVVVALSLSVRLNTWPPHS